jgi:L-threonylcarbamoyladenylate synthase
MLRLSFTAPSDLPGAVAAARVALDARAVIALPTETLYGLAVRPEDGVAVEAVFRLKGRGVEKALPVAVSSLEQADTLAELAEPWRSRLSAVWPAPLTVVLRRRGRDGVNAGTVAVRVPAHGLLRRLLARVGPLTVTSANRTGEPPAATAEEVAAALGPELGLLLDGGRTPGGQPSTLLDLTVEPPAVLRCGVWPVPPAWLRPAG